MKKEKSSVIKASIRQEELLTLEETEKRIYENIRKIKEVYDNQLKIVIQSVESHKEQSHEKIEKLTKTLQEITEKLKKTELELEETIKKVDRIREDMESVENTLVGIEKKMENKFDSFDNKFSNIENLISAQSISFSEVVQSAKNTKESTDAIIGKQDILYETQEKFINNLWKAFFSILGVIIAAGTGIGTFLASFLQ